MHRQKNRHSGRNWPFKPYWPTTQRGKANSNACWLTKFGRLGPAVLSAAILFTTSPVHAQQDPVHDFIQARGCEATQNWQLVFGSNNPAPYGKPFEQWTSADFKTLRFWIEKCLDPFVAVPGRKEWFLEEEDRKLAYLRQRHQKFVAHFQERERKQRAALEERERKQRLAEKEEEDRKQKEALEKQLRKRQAALEDQESVEQKQKKQAAALEEEERRKSAAAQAAEANISLQNAYDAKLAQFNTARAEYFAAAQALAKIQRIPLYTWEKELQPFRRFVATRKDASSLYSELKTLQPQLSGHRANTPLPAIENADTQAASTRVARVLEVAGQWDACGKLLASSGIPQAILLSRILVGEDADGHLFQYLCKGVQSGNLIKYLGAKGSRHGIRVSALQFWFEIRKFPDWYSWGPITQPGTSEALALVVEASFGDERQVAETPIQAARLGAAAITAAMLPH